MVFGSTQAKPLSVPACRVVSIVQTRLKTGVGLDSHRCTSNPEFRQPTTAQEVICLDGMLGNVHACAIGGDTRTQCNPNSL
jgi:hypothetical protein